jgi:alkylation response protein AidB-like acyl-CoA dehydrogenase
VLEGARTAGAPAPDEWRATWATAVELGWPTVGLPVAAGGLGLGQVGLSLLLEAAGRSICPVILSTAGLAGAALGCADPEPVIAEWQRRIAAGAVATLTTGVRAPVVGGRMRCAFPVVTDATRAEVFVVPAVRSGRDVLAVVEATDPAVEVIALDGPDLSVPIGAVRFDGVAPIAVVPVDDAAMLAACRTSVAADLVGGAQRSLELAVAHARERYQFGLPIGTFQGVKHPLADVYVGIERARSLTYGAAVLIDAASDDAPRAAAMAKAAASEAALLAAKVAIQTFGAMGTTWENGLHRQLGRARQGFALFGPPRDLYLEVAG